MNFVLVLDVPGIKDYVFGTEKLAEIRGASSLLDYLNREKTLEFLAEKLGQSNVKRVFTGGGAAQFLIQADEEKLNTALSGLKGLFHRETKGGLRLISGYAELPSDGGYQKSLSVAFSRLNREKDEEPFLATTPTHTGMLRECDSCSAPASFIDLHADSRRILCCVCHEKLNAAQESRGLWKEYADFLSAHGLPTYRRPRDFEEIGDASAKEGHLAVVYADGNSMGKLVKSIDSSDRFSFFSETVDRSIREACHEALHECCSSKGGKADILLLGGDDLLVCMSAEAAIPFSIEVARRFEAKTQERFARNPANAPTVLKGQGITISLGVVFAKSHTPFSLLLEQAEELLRSAKKGGSADSRASDYYAPSYLDFHLLPRFNQVKVADSRMKYLHLDHAETCLVLHQKPYALDAAETLYKHAVTLSREIPSSRFKRLGRAPYLGKINGTLECLRLVGRARDDKHKQTLWSALDAFGCGETIPWRPEKGAFSTMLIDLVEVGEFVKNTRKETANASDIA